METDVLVIGAGPAGAATAYFLARNGVKVLLIDRYEFPRDKICGDGITPAAIRVLERMGVVPYLKLQKHHTFSGARIFGPDGHSVHLANLTGYGFGIRRYLLDDVLRQHAMAAGAQFLPGILASEPIYDSNCLVGFSGKYKRSTQNINARITVVATGANSNVIRKLGISTMTSGPTAIAFRGYFHHVPEVNQYLEVYFDKYLLPAYGWIFPVGDETVNVGVAIDTSHSPLERGRPKSIQSVFHQFITSNDRVNKRLERCMSVESPRGFPVHMDFPTRKVFANGMLVAGEAAGLVDPITGEGIAFALQSGELVAHIAYNALLKGNSSARELSFYDQALKRKYLAYFVHSTKLRSTLSNSSAVSRLLVLLNQVNTLQRSRRGLRQYSLMLHLLSMVDWTLLPASYHLFEILRNGHKLR